MSGLDLAWTDRPAHRTAVPGNLAEWIGERGRKVSTDLRWQGQ